jgi:CubicO group peptidase (beta-lactamase class C family)
LKGGINLLNIEDVKNNLSILSKTLPSINIDSVFIEQNGNIEKYFYKDEQLHELRSCAKLLVAIAIGIAIDKGLSIAGEPLDLNTKIFPTIKDIVNITNKSNIEKIKEWTIKDLLTHTTGYESQMMSERFIQDIDKDNLVDYALNYDIPYEVGVRFAYNNVEPFILSVFFQEAFNQNLTDFINENIFKKLKILDYKWENYGKYCPGATGLYLKHSDFHKIGQLLLNDGKYNNNQIISSNWIKEMCSMKLETPSAYKSERVLPKIGIGYFTFISRDGYIFRDGSNGQYIILNKDKNLLITIMSTEKDMKNVTEILRNLI